jgi:hypothetical protein
VPDVAPPPFARGAGAALLVACLLLLGFFVALLAEDRSAVTALLLVFALVTVPALGSALLGLRAGLGLLRRQPPEAGAPVYAGLLAVGHVGVMVLSLQPGLDRRLDGGDIAGGGAGAAGLVAALVALALLLPWRTPAVRCTAAAATCVLVLALVSVRALAGTR